MLPVERVIGEEGLTSDPAGLRLAMRLPWYRSLPFSTVEVGLLAIDDEKVDLADAIVEYDGKSWLLADQGERIDTFWFVRDSAFLRIPGRFLQSGGDHRIELVLNVSPPYIPGMKRANPQSETMQVA